MAKGSRIIVTSPPRGVFEKIIVSGTPKPGTCMELKNVAAKGGRFTYEPAGTTAAVSSHGMNADGDRIGIAVLVCFADTTECPPGKLATDAYVDGDPGCVYWPAPGEELNVLLQDHAGPADDIVIDDKMIVDDGTGKILRSTGTVESEPFQTRESITDPTADQLVWCKFTGM